MTTRYQDIAFGTLKATDTHSEYVILSAFPMKQCMNAPQYYVPLRFTSLYYKPSIPPTCLDHPCDHPQGDALQGMDITRYFKSS